jgi:hypothetical protein
LQNEHGTASSDQIELSVLMQTVWSDFAKNPHLGPGWDKISTNFVNQLGLFGGARNPSGLQIISTGSADYACGLLDGIASAAKAGILEVGTL